VGTPSNDPITMARRLALAAPPACNPLDWVHTVQHAVSALPPTAAQATIDRLSSQVKSMACPRWGRAGVLTFDIEARTLFFGHEPLAFGRSRMLFDLLRTMAEASMPREVLFKRVWEEPHRGAHSDQRLRAAVSRLRKMTNLQLVLSDHQYRLVDDRAVWINRGAVRPKALRSNRIGRDALVRFVDERLHPGEPVTLIGPPGVGKTTVAAEVARQRPGTSYRIRLVAADTLETCSARV
jgi:hypothetical protein